MAIALGCLLHLEHRQLNEPTPRAPSAPIWPRGFRAFAGQAAYVAPLFVLAVSYVAIRARRHPGWWRRVRGIAILFVTLVIGLHLLEQRGVPPTDWHWRDQWRIGLLGEGGGLLGATMATALMVAFGFPGTGVIVGVAVLVALMLTF